MSARPWRDEHGLTWLENAPLIQLPPDSTAREPYPLDWEEQRRLFLNNTGWQCARRSVGLTQVRVHDLKHTFGRRLRTAGVPLETRKVLLWHKTGDITSHYSAPELAKLIRAANAVLKAPESTLLRVVTKQDQVVYREKSRRRVAERKRARSGRS